MALSRNLCPQVKTDTFATWKRYEYKRYFQYWVLLPQIPLAFVRAREEEISHAKRCHPNNLGRRT